MLRWPLLVDDFYKRMKKEQELLNISHKESVRQKRERKKKEKEKKEHVWQWWWDFDWLGKKCKNIYYGPRLMWMKLFRETKNKRKKKK